MSAYSKPGGLGGQGLELTDVLRSQLDKLPPMSPEQSRALAAILRCRTSSLGGHVRRCDDCGHLEVFYNSCRNRHCPKCQWLGQAEWLEARESELLPVPYFHTVFTVPRQLHPFFFAEPRLAYSALFEAASRTLIEVANNEKNLGARIGFTAVLHTWTQKLLFHPHIHCVIPGGGLSPDGASWLASSKRFFLPISILSEVFRGKLLSRLERAFAGKEVVSHCGAYGPELLQQAARKKFVVYTKRPFAGPRQVLRYLGRYTHRIALSNHRLQTLEGGQVSFWYRDRVDGNRRKLLRLPTREFLRRFLLHILPKGLVRLRHYGFLANAVKGLLLPRCQRLLGHDATASSPERAATQSWPERVLRMFGIDVVRCPMCGQRQMRTLGSFGLFSARWRVRNRGALW